MVTTNARKAIFFVVIILIIVEIILINEIIDTGEETSKEDTIPITTQPDDTFDDGILNTQRWEITREGDFKESTIDVYDVDPTEKVDYRLRLRADTIDTEDDTVKFHGVKSKQKCDFDKELSISFDLDWNNQSNGCYLTGSFYLSPNATNKNPREEDEWLKFEYVGVPPGKNARGVIARSINGKTKTLYDEGWPEEKIGRKIGNQHITIVLNSTNLKVIENGIEIYATSSLDLNFTSGYIYLQMSSHSNYAAREIYFDNIDIN